MTDIQREKQVKHLKILQWDYQLKTKLVYMIVVQWSQFHAFEFACFIRITFVRIFRQNFKMPILPRLTSAEKNLKKEMKKDESIS